MHSDFSMWEMTNVQINAAKPTRHWFTRRIGMPYRITKSMRMKTVAPADSDSALTTLIICAPIPLIHCRKVECGMRNHGFLLRSQSQPMVVKAIPAHIVNPSEENSLKRLLCQVSLADTPIFSKHI